jgi:phosphoglycolate phosphatase-like HAD superfamily hydrolase/8-oxo-dGTP pyrophosphatase MutT (NUDIX family)
MFRNLIFDWSGTLVDDLGPVIEATNAVLAPYGVPAFDREAFRRAFRLPYREFYEEWLPGVPLDELEARFRPAFDAAVAPVTVLPHALEKLDWCRALGIRTFVCTSMDAVAFARQLADFGLEGHFEATYAGVLDKREVIHQILETHRLDPAETAFIGDMTHDIETARHGGVASIAVLTGYQDAEVLATVRPDVTVPDLGVLRGLMERRFSRGGPVATVGALIHDGHGRVLLVRTRKWRGKWGIPGGKIHRGEPAVAALRREVMEETGLEIADIQMVLVQDSIDSPEFERPEHFLLLNYVARAICGVDANVALNDEADAHAWLAPSAALSLDLNHPTRVLLLDAISNRMFPHDS